MPPPNNSGLLGTDFLDKAGAIIDFETMRTSLACNSGKRQERGKGAEEHMALTVFPQDDTGRGSYPRTIGPTGHDLEQNNPHKHAQMSKSWLVKMAQEVTTAPRCHHAITATLGKEGKKEVPPLVCVEPATIPIQGIFAARARSRVGARADDMSRSTSHPAQDRNDAPTNSIM
jgi:hypothetical protein